MILIVSHPADDHAAGVLVALKRRGQAAVLVDTARFPNDVALTQSFENERQHYELQVGGQHIDLSECGAAWWRRPLPFTLAPGLAPEVASFTYSECQEAVSGLWSALDIHWVNPPALDDVAHHKPYQLAVATQVGLTIPRTLITNDPEAARGFIDKLGIENTVYKTFLASETCWRETRILRPEEIDLLDRVQLAPVIFQEFVPAAVDVRVTVVGAKMIATAVRTAPESYQVDYRMDMEGARFEPTELPEATQKRIRALMKRLGLVYGAIDLRRTADGQDIFLEINPAGEWRFVEERTGQPITEAMAELLVELDQQKS
jgi:glutathione synthase/RimK-type ligase-like ATP-grasp enzyme